MLTIIITTKNRPEYVNRQLKYYNEQKYSGKILIGDASDEEHALFNKKYVESYNSILNIEYLSQKNFSVQKSIYELSMIVDTEFCVSVADGGFLICKNLSKCTEFLEKNNEYVAAHGKALLFSLKNDGPYSKEIEGVSYYSLTVSEANSSIDRWCEFMREYTVPMYCVVRSDIYRSMWEGLDKIKNPSLAGEFVPSSIMVISGKIMELDFLYLVRHIHSKRTNLPSVYDWIVADDWSQSLKLTKKIIIKKILDNEQTDYEATEIKVNVAFKYFMIKILLKYLIIQGNGKDHDHLLKYLYYIKNYKKVIIGFLQNYPKIKKTVKIFDRRNKLKSSLMLDKQHKYYNDFYPIHQILINNQS